MKKVLIMSDGNVDVVMVDDHFTFSIKYHNQSCRDWVIPMSEEIIVGWGFSGIWLVDEDTLLIKNDNKWMDISIQMSSFLLWQGHSRISLRMLFAAIYGGLRSGCFSYSIMIDEIFNSYNNEVYKIKLLHAIGSAKATYKMVNKKESLKNTYDVTHDKFRFVLPDGSAAIFENITEDIVLLINNSLICNEQQTYNRDDSVLTEEKRNRILSKGLAAAERLNALKPKDGYRVLGKVYEYQCELRGVNPIARRQWSELSNCDIVTIMAAFPEVSESDMHKYWDEIDEFTRMLLTFNKD